MLTQHPIQNSTTQRQVNFRIPGLFMSKSKLIALPEADITLEKSMVGRWMFRLKWHLFRVHVSFLEGVSHITKKVTMKFSRGCETRCFLVFTWNARVAEVVGDAEVNVGNSSSEIHGFRSVYESWGRQCEWFLDCGNLNFRCEGCVFINAKGCLRSVVDMYIYIYI